MNRSHTAHRRPGVPRRLAGTVLVLLSFSALVTGCSGGQDEAGDDPAATASPAASASASPADPQPGPDPGETGGPAGGPAFEPASSGPPEVDRGEGSSLRQESVDPVTFADEATWSDGLSATTGGFARGTITATGVGAVTGADYVAIDVDVKNLSDEEIPLDSVVATLLVGDEALPAAPAYDVEAAADLSGTLAPGDTATGTYVFQVGQDIGAATFYLDVDGNHAVATFSGSFE